MLSSPVYAKLQPGTDPSSARTRHATISPFLIHPLCFHIHPHSFAQWTAPISLSFNRFRTLSIVMGGGGIPIAKSLNHHFNCAPSPHATPIHQNRPRPFVSTTYKLPIFYLLCFDIHPCNGGGVPPSQFFKGAPAGRKHLRVYPNSSRFGAIYRRHAVFAAFSHFCELAVTICNARFGLRAEV